MRIVSTSTKPLKEKMFELVSSVLPFINDSGNKYIYDNYTGLMLPDEPAVMDKLCGGQSEYLGVKRRSALLPKRVSVDDVKTYIAEHGYTQLTLEMTADCNFRCKYCIYGEHYPETRKWASETLNFDTAKKAVDYYMTGALAKYRKNPNSYPTIGFYGGEPLLQFPVIRQIVEYVDREYSVFPYVLYTITTNGYLLTDEIGDFMTEHNFSIIVSLDGHKENHDRNRVTVNQKGTFDVVFGNINRLRERHPGYDKFGLSVCFDYKTDLFKMRDFIRSEDLFIVKFSQISSSYTDYYNQFTTADEQRFREQMTALRKEFLATAKNGTLADDGFLFAMFGTEYTELSFHSMPREVRPSFLPYTAACIPGDKIYVTPDGKYHICERVPHDMPIGDVDHGFDYAAIVELLELYNRDVCKHCPDCPISRMCGICFSSVRTEHTFKPVAGYCSAMVNRCKEKMSELTQLLESNPGLMEQVTVDYYQEVIRKAGYIVE